MRHTFSTVLETAGTQSLTATDATDSLTGSETGIVVSANTAASLIVSGYTTATTAGTANSFTVTAADAYGNVATGFTGTVALSSSDTAATFSATPYTFTSGIGDDNGTHTFSATLNTGGTQSIAATDSGDSLSGSESGVVVDQAPAITSGAGTTFTVAAPGSFTVLDTGFPAPTLSGPLSDAFVGSNNTDLTAHAMNSGPGWTQPATVANLYGPVSTSPFLIEGNTATMNGTGAGGLDITNGGFSDGTISVTVTASQSTNGIFCGVAFRVEDGMNFWGAAIGTDDGFRFLVLYEFVAGSLAFDTFSYFDYSPGTPYTLQVTLSGPSIGASIGAGPTVSTTSSDFQTATYCGLDSSDNGATYSGFSAGAATGLPADLTFNATTGVLSGTPSSGDVGTYNLSFTAANGVSPNATQAFVLTVGADYPLFTSAAAASFTVGASSVFSVAATGYPAPTFSEAGALPSGLTFNDGTGLLSGTPATGTGGTYALTFMADNGVAPDATQSFLLTVDQAPAFTERRQRDRHRGRPGQLHGAGHRFPGADADRPPLGRLCWRQQHRPNSSRDEQRARLDPGRHRGKPIRPGQYLAVSDRR